MIDTNQKKISNIKVKRLCLNFVFVPLYFAVERYPMNGNGTQWTNNFVANKEEIFFLLKIRYVF